jgi:hypothetical protein
VGLFRRDKESNGDGSIDRVPDDRAPVDLLRFDRLVRNSLKLRELGVPYEAIERRAARDAVTFNEALEALYREHVRG